MREIIKHIKLLQNVHCDHCFFSSNEECRWTKQNRRRCEWANDTNSAIDKLKQVDKNKVGGK